MDKIISKIKALKQIEPSKDWAILTKTRIFESSAFQGEVFVNPIKKRSIFDIISEIFTPSYQKGFAYVSAFILLLVAGMFGFAQYTLPGDPLFAVKRITEQSQAALTGEGAVQSNVANLKKRSHDLEEVLNKQKGDNLSFAKKEVKDATKNLADAIQMSAGQAEVKEIAMEIKNNQVLLSFFEDYDLKQESLTLYKAIGEQMIADLEKSALTEAQEAALKEAKELYDEGMYFQAMERLLLVGGE